MTQGYREVKGALSVFGWGWRVLFWGWQALMIAWMWGAGSVGGELGGGAGAAAAVAVGWAVVAIVWALGSVIFGIPVMLTRRTVAMVPVDDIGGGA